MGFLSPLFLAGALTAAIPVVLHLLRHQPDVRVRFAAVDLLRTTPVEQADRRRLRQWLLLALRVTALLALAFAFSRPFFASGAAVGEGGATIVALDTSLSQSSPEHFSRAQQLARQVIAEAPTGHLIGVLTFADRATPGPAPSADRTLAGQIIDGARAGAGATHYRTALQTAVGLLEGRPGRIVLVTDLQASGWDAGDKVSLPPDVAVEVRDAGAPPPNLAVTDVRVAGDRVVATIRSSAPTDRQVTARLHVDGVVSGESSGTVVAGGALEISFPTSPGSAARVSIDDAEGLAGDNERFLVLDASAGPRILVITSSGDLDRDAYYVRHALDVGGPDRAAFTTTGLDGARFSALDETELGRYSGILLMSTKGLDQRGRELVARFASGDGGVLVAAGPDVDAEVASDALGKIVTFSAALASEPGADRRFAPTDLRHPVLRPFAPIAPTLGLARFTRIQPIEGRDCQTIARFSSGESALVDCQTANGRVLAFGSDLSGRWNDLPVHATFVPFLHEAVRYVVGERAKPGSYLVGAVPAGIEPVPGIAQLPGRATRVAVNVDPRESDPARVDPAGFQEAIARSEPVPDTASGDAPDVRPSAARRQEEQQRLWRYAVLLMAAVLVAESLVAAKTV